MQLLKENIV